MSTHLRSRPWSSVGLHAAGLASGLAVITLLYFAFYAGSGEDYQPRSVLAYSVIPAGDGLQVWRLGATKAMNPDADFRLVYSTAQACTDPSVWQNMGSVEVQPVDQLTSGGFMRPGRLLLSDSQTTLSQLCSVADNGRTQFWATDSGVLKVNLERLGALPAFYASSQ
jgi:hypothetical protein